MNRCFTYAACIAAIALPCAFGLAQTPCRGTALQGTVRDSTQALIPKAAVTLDGGASQVSGADGRFRFACVGDGKHELTVSAVGFAGRQMDFVTPMQRATELDVELKPEDVRTQVNVDDGEDSTGSAGGSAATATIAGSRLQSLADDPDDLLRELQQLAATTGGNPASTTISVDGFQGSSSLPPKSAIAYIKVNPDLFAAEYRQPPFDGGRVEVYTKPGQKAYHGALFLTNGSAWENARDPFSTSKAAVGKQRYGFELTGPVRRTGSDFSLTLEHRSIDNFAVVDAITLDGSGNTESVAANVATPQRLWLGTARVDWQLGAKNTFIASYSANVNHLANVGAGGTSLAETGYDSERYEHMFRLSDVTTPSARVMHEARLSLRWDGETDAPNSTAPQVQVAGAFTGGGASIGQQQTHELNVEADDDAILTTKNHTIKFGTQMMIFDEHEQLTTNFNGTYTFGGGTAPVLDASGQPVAGESETITGVEQYRRAEFGLAGGTPTAFSDVAGTPTVDFVQVTDALFYEDDWNAGRGLHIAYGLRYWVQNSPVLLNSFAPRLGVMWSPDKKGRWTLHGHVGLFNSFFSPGHDAEVRREDGVARVTSTVYNPVYGNPLAGATPIHSIREFSPHIGNVTFLIENVGGTRVLPGGWNVSGDFFMGRIWNDSRTVNVNAPLNGQPGGPRAGAANLNVYQLNNSGQGRLEAVSAQVEQHSIKHVQLFFGGVWVDVVDDTDDYDFLTPQNSFSDAGEFAHRTGQTTWNVFGNATVTLPKKVQWSWNFNGGGDAHYNITTGFDNNGDGDFNDRPQYAAPGTPGAVATPYGLLVASGGTGVFPRNKGVMPWTFYLDTNVQRVFALTRNPKAEHQQTVTVNLRSSNVLNHLNVTQVGGVLGSPLFGVPYAADNGRGLRRG